MSQESQNTILAVAADQLTLAVRGLVLRSEGYQVISASNSQDAMRLTATRRPDLIICDQIIGKENGLALATCLKELQPETPILLITGLMDSLPQSLSVDAVMTKIDGPEAFLQNVAALLQRPEASRQAS